MICKPRSMRLTNHLNKSLLVGFALMFKKKKKKLRPVHVCMDDSGAEVRLLHDNAAACHTIFQQYKTELPPPLKLQRLARLNPMLLHLPRVWSIIIRYLDGEDLQALRATCRKERDLVDNYSPSTMRFAFYRPKAQPGTSGSPKLECYCYFNRIHSGKTVPFQIGHFVPGSHAVRHWVLSTTEIEIDTRTSFNNKFIALFNQVLMLFEYYGLNGFRIKFLYPVDADKDGFRYLIERINYSTCWFKADVHIYQFDTDREKRNPVILGPRFANVTYDPHYDSADGPPPYRRFWLVQGSSIVSNLSTLMIGGNSFKGQIDLQSTPLFFPSSRVKLEKLIFLSLEFVVNTTTSNWSLSSLKELHFVNCSIILKANLVPICNPCFVSDKLVITGEESNVLQVFGFPQLTNLTIENSTAKLPYNPLPNQFSLPSLKCLFCRINPSGSTSFVQSLRILRKLETLILFYYKASEKSIQRLAEEVIFNTPTLKNLRLFGDHDQLTRVYSYPSWQEEYEFCDSPTTIRVLDS